MSTLNKMITVKDVNKFQWCAKVAMHLEQYDWRFEEAYELAENLHYSYVEDPEEWEADPIETLKEEMTYWGD